MEHLATHSSEATPKRSFWQRHKVLTLILGAIIASLVLVSVSYSLYQIDGTAQLDLSRPGYEGVSTRLDKNVTSFEGYSAQGPIDRAALEEFDTLFTTQVEQVSETKIFSSDPLSPEELGIQDPALTPVYE